MGLCSEIHDTWQIKSDIRKCEALISDTLSHGGDESTSGGASSTDGSVEVRHRDVAAGASGEATADSKPMKTAVTAEEQRTTLLLKLKYEGIDPSILDAVHYCFSYCGLLTGLCKI